MATKPVKKAPPPVPKKVAAKQPVAAKPKVVVGKPKPAEATIGHNSNVGGISGQRLKSFVTRIENVEDEIKALRDDVKEIYTEAKGVGFVPKIVKKIVVNRRRNKEQLREEKELTELYALAIDPDLADVLS